MFPRLNLFCLPSHVVIINLAIIQIAVAQDAKTYAGAFAIPVIEQIDKNGVDLLSGRLRISSPVLDTGSDAKKTGLGLIWAGNSWQFVDQPTLWRDGAKYIVNYGGVSEEFGDRGSGYAQKKPITGSKLSCSIFMPGNLAAACVYQSRLGDIFTFRGVYSSLSNPVAAYGPSTRRWGNIGMHTVDVTMHDGNFFRWGSGMLCGNPCFTAETDYNKPTVVRSLGDQTLTIQTPSFSGSGLDDNYLYPKSVTQTITTHLGAQWRYTFDGGGKLTVIQQPGDFSVTTIQYDGDRVRSVTNADGTWAYSYVNIGANGITTVTSPLNESSVYTYQRDKNSNLCCDRAFRSIP